MAQNTGTIAWSCHVDLTIGDRRSRCKGLMEPISIWVEGNGEWSIIHRCKKCGIIRTNRIAGEDNELALILLAMRPLKQSAFPLNELELYDMIKE
jgi:ribosome biogenesis GTPase